MDVERLKGFSRLALDRLVEKPLLAAVPVALWFAGAMLDLYVGLYAWWLAVGLGVVEGAAWGVWYAKLEEATGRRRVLIIGCFTVTMGVQGWNYAGGLLLMLVFCVVPVFELERHAGEFMAEQGQTWLFSQAAQGVEIGRAHV
jgi:hypothetical protein